MTSRSEVSIIVGGQPGDGTRVAGNVIGRIFNRLGYHIFILEDYPSIIRDSGHTFSQVTVSRDRVWSHFDRIDLLVALNGDTVDRHEKDLVKGGAILYDEDVVRYEGSALGLPIPLTTTVKEAKGRPVMRNSVAIGALAHLHGVPMKTVEEVFKSVFGAKNLESNLDLAKRGYEHSETNFERLRVMEPTGSPPRPLITGNDAIVLGAAKAGLRVYIAYPMTPSTSLLHYAVAHRDDLGLVAVQAENEIGVINMSLGCVYAGSRTMIGTSGGGFDLMQEAFSLAGMCESPLVVVLSQRTGPSTGLPTHTAQSDLGLALNAGHGEFPRVVVAPGDVEESFYKANEALNLAWKYQVPVIILVDKHLSESTMSAEIDETKATLEEAKLWEGLPERDGYKRYAYATDGVSALAFPGSDAVVKSSSYEHTQHGYSTEDPEETERMVEKRFAKLKGIERELREKITVKLHGQEDAENLVVSWGSTKGAVIEALKLVDVPIRFIQVLYLSPFPTWEVEKHLRAARKVVSVEVNFTGQLSKLLRTETGHLVDGTIRRYDGRPFEPLSLSKELRRFFG